MALEILAAPMATLSPCSQSAVTLEANRNGATLGRGSSFSPDRIVTLLVLHLQCLPVGMDGLTPLITKAIWPTLLMVK